MNDHSNKISLNELEIAVLQHYESIFGMESLRLVHHSPIEFAITTRCIGKWLGERCEVADIGVGAGHYAEFLARKGCSLRLIDISQRFLDTTCDRLRSAGLGEEIAAVFRASATDLHEIPSGTCQAVLLLGPLYHLLDEQDRRTAVMEAERILTTGGLLFAAGINRLAYFRDLIRTQPLAAAKREQFHQEFLLDGNLNPANAPLIGYAHLTTVAEFRDLFREAFEELELVGVESFAGAWQHSLLETPATDWAAWLTLVEQTASSPEGLAASDHFLFVGRKR